MANTTTHDLIIQLTNKIDALTETVNLMKTRDEMFRDFIVELMVNKKESTIIQATQKKVKPVDNIVIITEYYKNMLEQMNKLNTAVNIVKSFTVDSIKTIEDKLKDNAANNIKNCFVWCYSHINETRIETLNLPNIEQFVMLIYDNKNELDKYNSKGVIELLKYEANKIFKKYKDEVYFKKHCENIKKKYKN